ncbi:MAG TPA: right-handed parallel beta-helix repeat-containing protein, partial [bacterium]|nr:right-handed parallel beta-helix repeat-containing protein [bacterium]
RSESGDPSRCMIDCEQVVRGGSGEINHAFEFIHTLDTEPILEGITITRGWAGLGGAVEFWYSSPRVRNCVFIDNAATEGGAIMCQTASPILENCVIVQNTSTEYPGGGVFCGWSSHVTIKNCTIAGNRVMNGREGGGIAVINLSSVAIGHSIISGQTIGEAIYCNETATASLSCTNVYGNAGGDWVGCIADQLNLSGNFSMDPIFCNPSERIFTIREDSPCAPPGITGCGLVGALPIGCDVVSVTESTWGKIKAAYR